MRELLLELDTDLLPEEVSAWLHDALPALPPLRAAPRAGLAMVMLDLEASVRTRLPEIVEALRPFVAAGGMYLTRPFHEDMGAAGPVMAQRICPHAWRNLWRRATPGDVEQVSYRLRDEPCESPCRVPRALDAVIEDP